MNQQIILCADTVHGVYFPSIGDILPVDSRVSGEIFLSCLSHLEDGEMVWALVSEEIFSDIMEIYGVH